MDVNFSDMDFSKGQFSFDAPNGVSVLIREIDEALESESGVVEISGFTISAFMDGVEYSCSSVIGTSNSFFSIMSAHKELEGSILTKENCDKAYLHFEV